ncbi:PAS domain-containing protein, partial [Listeria seeligeri]|uniref:PAS domain-containing protein n=1 Tax=Listeria seeligeri TaxID=1640 RepID=UPI0022EA45F1
TVFYLPRILVNLAETAGQPAVTERLQLMGLRLYRFGHSMFGLAFLLGLVLWLLHRQIGRRLHAERQSLRSAARAASVLQTVREPIVLLDRELRVQLHNPAFAELYGLEDERADG